VDTDDSREFHFFRDVALNTVTFNAVAQDTPTSYMFYGTKAGTGTVGNPGYTPDSAVGVSMHNADTDDGYFRIQGVSGGLAIGSAEPATAPAPGELTLTGNVKADSTITYTSDGAKVPGAFVGGATTFDPRIEAGKGTLDATGEATLTFPEAYAAEPFVVATYSNYRGAISVPLEVWPDPAGANVRVVGEPNATFNWISLGSIK
jgi:hypothetical protein